MLDGPRPGRARLVPLIVPRLTTTGLTIGFAFDGGRPNAPLVLARPPLLFAPKPVGAAAGLLTNAGRSCRWPFPCSVPPGRPIGWPIASRVTRPALSFADRRGRKIGRANGLTLRSPSFAASRRSGRPECTAMRVSIASESLPPPVASSRAGGREPSGFAGEVEPPPSRAASSARQTDVIPAPISAIARRRTTTLKAALLGIIPPVPRRMRHRTAHDRPRPGITSAAPARPPRG